MIGGMIVFWNVTLSLLIITLNIMALLFNVMKYPFIRQFAFFAPFALLYVLFYFGSCFLESCFDFEIHFSVWGGFLILLFLIGIVEIFYILALRKKQPIISKRSKPFVICAPTIGMTVLQLQGLWFGFPDT